MNWKIIDKRLVKKKNITVSCSPSKVGLRIENRGKLHMLQERCHHQRDNDAL